MEIVLSDRISKTAPYAFAEVDAKVQELKSRGMEVIDFGVGDPSSPAPDFVIDALTQMAKKHAASGYPSYIGSKDFRTAAAKYMQREFNVMLDPDKEIISTIGSKESVFNFPLGFINPGDLVICPSPGYPPYKNGTRFAGGVPYFVPLTEQNNFLIDFQSIPSEVCRSARIIWINYPNSPSGSVASKTWLSDLISWAHQHNIIIAADEGCYIDIYFDQKPVSILELERDGIIAFYSLSKRNNMTGYRVGFNAGDERIIAAFKKVKTNIDSGTPDFVQEVAIKALEDTQHAASMRQEYRQKRDLMLQAFKAVGLPECPSQATFYLWQKAPQGMTGEMLAAKFLELGIVVTPGAWISDVTQQGENPGQNYVRFALVPPLQQVKRAAQKVCEARW